MSNIKNKKGLLFGAASATVIVAACAGIAGGTLGAFTTSITNANSNSDVRTFGLTQDFAKDAAFTIDHTQDILAGVGTLASTVDTDTILPDYAPTTAEEVRYVKLTNNSTSPDGLSGKLFLKFGTPSVTKPVTSTVTDTQVLQGLKFDIQNDSDADGVYGSIPAENIISGTMDTAATTGIDLGVLAPGQSVTLKITSSIDETALETAGKTANDYYGSSVQVADGLIFVLEEDGDLVANTDGSVSGTQALQGNI